MYYDFDILRVSRANRTYLNLPDYKLKTIEKFLGIDREDTISGKESVEMYYDYVSTKDPILKSKILLHNYEDILNIVDLFSIFNFCKQSTIYKEFNYPIDIYNVDGSSCFDHNFYIKLGLSKSFEELRLYLIDYRLKGNLLTCVLDSNVVFDMEFIYEKQGLKLSMQDGLLELSLPLLSFVIEGVEYLFIDIDHIYGDGSFNKLSPKDKMELNISAKKAIIPHRIIAFLKDNLYTVINHLIV